MGLAESQKFLARLSTDPALRARFASDPVAVATEFGLSFDERRSFEELTPGPITGFAGSLIGKRRGEVESLLPLTVRALGPDRFARLFRQHAANFVPAGIKKHRDDAVTFARWLAREVADPAWLADLASLEAAALRTYSQGRRLDCVALKYRPTDLVQATAANPIPRRASLVIWFRISRNGRLRQVIFSRPNVPGLY